ncbi:MAG: response regulator transcription factor [Eubacteriaceae bacterium]|nr:response regulator transcription factor [Eubacteriaceae bacterium]
MKILLAEDEKRMAQSLSELLRQENYEVDVFGDGSSALDAALSGIYDAAVLDVMMPGMDGFSVAKSIRKEGISLPIIMLTALSDVDDKVTGLDSGADDYLTKPFMAKELLARLRALLRRNSNIEDGRLSYGDIVLDTGDATLTCTATSQSVRLSEKEMRILEYMISNKGRILSREQLAVRIWGYESDAEYNNVEVYMSFTRKKLSFVGAATSIKAVRGVGYELRYDDV